MPPTTPIAQSTLLPRGYTAADTELRRAWLEQKTGVLLDELPPDPPEQLKGIIENHVGYVGLPLAVAGPLVVRGSYAEGTYYVPLCTVEGTLALSMTRGAYLTSLSGGILTRHLKQEVSRSPVFIFPDVDACQPFLTWIEAEIPAIRRAAESTTRHGKLIRIDKYVVHNSVLLDFVYNTADAAGQNMVTLASHAACHYISEHYRGSTFRYLIESNFNGDKNPAARTLLLGRGHQVIASAMVSAKALRRVVRTTAQAFVDGWTQCTRASQLAGVMGLNMHVANGLAAIYLATGQDVACVVENSLGLVNYEVQNGGDLYATLSMPSICVGTVGGGTRLAAQRRNLELLGCTGDGSSKRLSEIVCAAALALELSLGGAIASNEFALAHRKYGR
jgi:hydroxymethylglutaryl-CoA reductase (NADPH)